MWQQGVVGDHGVPVPAGSCLSFIFGEAVTYAADPEWDFVYINLCGSAALSMIEELTRHHGHVLPVNLAQPAVVRLIDLARGPGVRHQRLGLAVSARIAGDLLMTLAEGCQGVQDPERDCIDAACAYLIRHLARPIDVADAAAEVGVSREHLTRLFRRRLGVAPASWLRRERLRHAELLVRGSRLPLQEVARRSGFATASHFVQAFRRQHGLTPGHCRG